MCGIAGQFAWRDGAPPPDEAVLVALSDSMRARGPDGEGRWRASDHRTAFVHRRLAIIDLSPRGAQPMALHEAGLTITYNGEIYNHLELRQELERDGAVFRSDCDTEVLLHLFARHGEAMLPRLRGMFALAIWDQRRQRLTLARDSFGIKPLYYADTGASLYFASQVKALLHAPVDRSPDPAGRAGFLLWGSVPDPWTLFKGIRALPAGHSLSVTGAGVGSPVPFLTIDALFRDAQSQPAPVRREEGMAMVVDAVRDTVRAHHVADVPVGVFLSAGLDSAMLALATARLGAGRADAGGHAPRTLTLGFDEFTGSAVDETPIAESLARLAGSRHRSTSIRRGEFEADGPALFAAMDQPTIDGVNTWFVARAAHADGLKVALSGLGGDEIFASYPSFRDVPRLAARLAPLQGLPVLGRTVRRLAAPWIGALGSPKYAGLLEYGGSLAGAYLLRRALFMPWELPALLGGQAADEGLEALDTVARLHASHDGIESPRLAVSALEMQWYMRHQLLRDADWAGMAHSLEIRVPFVDLEFLRRVAPVFARFPDIGKPEVAAAVAPQLPAAVLHRAKTGFVVPVRDWLSSQDAVASATHRDHARGLRGWALRCLSAYTQPAPSQAG